MKNIIDFYECDLNAGNPANTIGMGNPKPPSFTNNGSEPLTIIKRNKKDKHKKQKIEEASLLDIDANLEITDEEAVKSAITQYINNNYDCEHFTISDKPNKDGKYEVSSAGNARVKNKNITSLTNDLFVWNRVGDNFYCISCKFLTSLEGAPKVVNGDFNCIHCHSLQSLKGAPKEVGGFVDCANCNSLQSLEGAPKVVKKNFNCSECNYLQSLKGSPEKVGRDFYCNDCHSLQSLKGAPKEVGGYFVCSKCKIKFEVSDIRAVSNVRGKIIV